MAGGALGVELNVVAGGVLEDEAHVVAGVAKWLKLAIFTLFSSPKIADLAINRHSWQHWCLGLKSTLWPVEYLGLKLTLCEALDLKMVITIVITMART